MKKIYLFIAICFAVFSQNTKASHVFATNITCIYSGTPNTYSVTYKMYRDCSGIPAPLSVSLCFSSVTLAFTGTVNLTPIVGTGLEVTLGPCYQPGGVTTCSGGANVGIQEYVYTGTMVLPGAATDWIISYTECCRAGSVTNLAGSGNSYLYTTIDNLNYPTNSTPQFTFPAWAQYCINMTSTHSFTATDVDGDSLVYSMDNCLGNPTCTSVNVIEPYLAPFNTANPFSSSAGFSLNTATGELNFTPDLIQYATVAINLSEYRNGQLISVTHREDLIASINGVIGTDTITGKVYNDLNANAIYDAGEPGMNGQIIETTPGPYYYSTNILGDYASIVPVNNYNITVHSNYPFYYYTPANHTANFTAFGQSDAGNDFGFGVTGNIQDMRITLTGNNVRPSLPSTLYLTATNMGTVVNNAVVNLTLDPAFTYNSAIPAPTTVTGNTLSWTIANMQMLQSQNFTVDVSIGNLPLGNVLNSYAEILPIISDTIPDDNVDSLAQTVVNSCDPNEKFVSPDDWITTAQIDNGLYLEYTVFFQNIGTAPAINISITDTLDPYFNIPTFEILSASHSYTWRMSGQGVVTYTFANIYLPDSNANEPASHGFIKYRIKPQNNLFNNEKLVNIAYIFFDSNAPIETNYTSTHVYHFTGINSIKNDDVFALYPNPANEYVTLSLLPDFVSAQKKSIHIKVTDVFGKEVMNENFNTTSKNKIMLNTKELAGGIYFVILNTGEKSFGKKLVVE